MHGSRADRAYWMRAYLRNKARTGRWDDRMLNGHAGNINLATRKFIMRGVALDLVCTSTTGGQHAPSSYHYKGAAADMGLPSSLVGSAKGQERMLRFQRQEAGHADRYLELFGPDNKACVKNGRVITLAEGSPLENLHDNHVHGAART